MSFDKCKGRRDFWQPPMIGRNQRVTRRVANSFERILGAASLRALSKRAFFEFSFHAIHSIGLKFTIDKHTQSKVAWRVLSRTNLAESSPSTSFASSISFSSFRLRTLDLSLRSFLDSRPLFSTTSALFSQNTRGGIPLRHFFPSNESQQSLFLSPLLSPLTHP